MNLEARRLRSVLPALALVGASTWAPVSASAQVADKTRVYVVVVDGLNLEEVPLMPFLSSLAASGTFYQEARSVMVAETTPNHVAMVTGAYPDKNGIVANDFPGVRGSAPDAVIGEGTTAVDAGDSRLLQADSIFTLVSRQCPELTTAAVTSKDYLFNVMEHDRDGDGERDADSNFENSADPTFIPGAGITPDERTIAEALSVVQDSDPDFLFLNLGAVDRSGHVDVVGGATTPTGSRPAVRDVQRTNTDTYLRTFVETLKAQGTWDSTRLLITADHSMDWSLPTGGVTVSDNPELADVIDEFVVAQNGGAALFSLRDRTRPDAPQLLKRVRDSALATEGVDEVLYRQPNPADGGEQHWVGRVHPDWHQTGPRSGDLILTVEDGRRSTEPSSTSNPIPGNHGMPSTLRIPMIVAGGADAGVVTRTVPGDDNPGVRAADQAENVDLAPTAAWLLGVQPPAAAFDGRALTEAFSARPAPSCVSAAGAPGTQVPAPQDLGTSAPPAPTPTGQLPATGALWLVSAAGLVLGALAVGARRRARSG